MLHSVRTYRKTGGIDFRFGRRYVCTQRLTLLPHIIEMLHLDKVVVPILGTPILMCKSGYGYFVHHQNREILRAFVL